MRFLLDYLSTKERPDDLGLLEEGLVCNTHGVLFCNDPSFSDKTPAGRVSDKQRYSVRPVFTFTFLPHTRGHGAGFGVYSRLLQSHV